MMQRLNALQFGREWTAAWIARDVEAVLAHFHDDVLFVSPVARKIGFSSDGAVRGKEALRRYWRAALEINPALHFTLRDVLAGVATIAILFTNQEGIDRIEALRFRDNLVVEGLGAFIPKHSGD
jgi:ketosteroid isomerase-like protein